MTIRGGNRPLDQGFVFNCALGVWSCGRAYANKGRQVYLGKVSYWRMSRSRISYRSSNGTDEAAPIVCQFVYY
jgi:hypothetical protein